MGIGAKVISAAKTLRANDWWQTKVPFLLGIFYWFLTPAYQFGWGLGLQILALLVWIVGAAGFGYFVNDCFDIEQDRQAGKANAAAKFSVTKRWLIASTLLVVSLLPWLYLAQSAFVLVLIGLHLLSFITYSVPPLRFKERYYLGVLNDAVYAYLLPVAIVAYTAYELSWNLFGPAELPHGLICVYAGGYYEPQDMVLLWALLAGLRNIIQHHLIDRKEDKRSGTKNVAIRYGIRFNVNINRFVLIPLELLTFALMFGLNNAKHWIFLLVFGVYLILELPSVIRIDLRERYRMRFEPALFSINRFYEEYLPLLALLYLGLREPLFFIVMALHQLIFPNKVLKHFMELVFHHLILKWLWIIRLILSRIVNYSIYYVQIALGLRKPGTAKEKP